MALGLRFQQLGIWSVIAKQVHIKQKVRQHKPFDKLLDCFIITVAFQALLGAVAVAAALAFGLGGREIAAGVLEDWMKQLKSRK